MRFDPEGVREALQKTPKFFVVALGRSGTTFLADLLDRAPGCAVFHEARGDWPALSRAFANPETAHEYLAGARERLVAARIRSSGCAIYGEVNSYLRYHVPALIERWDPTILHLFRDGRAVVRSVMNRPTFTPEDRSTVNLMPRREDPWAAEFPQFDRFAKVCWYWASTNRDLLDWDLARARFEDVTASYEAFSEQVLEPLGLDVSREIWEERVGRPKNASKSNHFPAWEDWSSRQQEQFERICGPVMARLGYSL